MQPVVDGLVDEYNDHFEFRRLDANSQDGKEAFQAYGLRVHPSFVIIDPEGNQLWLSLGEQPREVISQVLDDLLTE
jgi:predicted DsbA family dithiol-disulfide isomerase